MIRPALAGLLSIASILAIEPARAQCPPQWDTTVALPGNFSAAVEALAVFDDGSGPALYAGGRFTQVLGVPISHVARWNGSSWLPVGAGLPGDVYDLAVFDDGSGSGPALYAVGGGLVYHGTFWSHIARWDGLAWSDAGGGLTNLASAGNNATTFALAPAGSLGGGGPRLYAGGMFNVAGGASAQYVAEWNGTAWAPLGVGAAGFAKSLAIFDDGLGGGPALYVGEAFSSGTSARDPIARWDGSTWSTLGSVAGAGGPPPGGQVDALTVHDDGSGAALYAGGAFNGLGGVSAPAVARWDGHAWSSLGFVLGGGSVQCLASFNDGSGSGPALFAGGGFATIYGAVADHVARWDRSTWSSLGNGVNGAVEALAVFDDGSGHGPALYVAGSFSAAGGSPTGYIARWGRFGTPASISQQPAGAALNAGHPVAIEVIVAGSAPLAFQWRKGGVAIADGGPISGATTSRLTIDPVAVSDAGNYDVVVSNPCNLVTSAAAALIVLPEVGTRFCTGDGSDPLLTVFCPCFNLGMPGHGCASSASSSGALLDAFGSTAASPTTGTDTVVLACTSMPATATAIFVQADAVTSAGAVFGDGIRCLSGSWIRLAVHSSTGGGARYPEAGEPSVSTAGMVTPGSGAIRYYQTVYRDPDPAFCTPAALNSSNGYEIVW